MVCRESEFFLKFRTLSYQLKDLSHSLLAFSQFVNLGMCNMNMEATAQFLLRNSPKSSGSDQPVAITGPGTSSPRHAGWRGPRRAGGFVWLCRTLGLPRFFLFGLRFEVSLKMDSWSRHFLLPPRRGVVLTKLFGPEISTSRKHCSLYLIGFYFSCMFFTECSGRLSFQLKILPKTWF